MLLRLEAKLDALSKENAALRDRVKRIETVRSAPAAPVRVASLGNSASDASPSAPTAVGRTARAANYPVKAMPAAVSRCANFAGWTGGVNVGSATHSSTWNDNDNWVDNFNFDFNTSNPSKTRTGVTAGLSGGYNWQSGCALYGVEVDGSWTSIKGTTTASPVGVPGTTLTIADRLNWWGTVRGRAGVVVDNLLIYTTGGFAFAKIRHDWSVVDPTVPAAETFSAHSGRWGGVAGVGTEWSITPQWSVRSEFLYVYFKEDHQRGLSRAGAQIVHFDAQDSMFVSRIGAVYRWGGGL
jgi:outer membrane immunogenic protein